MIEYVIAAAAVGGAIAIADHENWIPAISNNPQKLWFWERLFPQPAPAPTVRFPQQIQPSLTPQQELQQARLGVVSADQMLASVSRKYPSLVVQSKYQMTSQPTQTMIPPYTQNNPYGY